MPKRPLPPVTIEKRVGEKQDRSTKMEYEIEIKLKQDSIQKERK